MADSQALFNDKNKIRMVDLDVELSNTLKSGLITEEDRKKLNSLSSDGGTSKIDNPLEIIVNGSSTVYDGSTSKTIEINTDTIGAATKDHDHNYAAADEAGGAANSAKKLDHNITINIKGAVTGSANTDGSSDLDINTTVTHEHNYAGSEFPMGPANSAKKLTAPVRVNITGAVTGSATTDGSTNILIETSFDQTSFPEVLDANLK